MPARNRGSITLELLIAFAVASLVIASTILLVGGSDALAFEHEDREQWLAHDMVESALAALSIDPFSLIATTTLVALDTEPYGVSRRAVPVTPCLQTVSAVATSSATFRVAFTAWFADAPLMLALGGDCETESATSSWANISLSSGDSIPGVTSTALDVLRHYAYIGLTASPYFALMDLSQAGQGTTQGLAVPFENDFRLTSPINALDAAFVNGHPYVFAAMATSTGQFAVIDVSDPKNPVLIASRSLAGIKSDGADPAAYHVLYDDGRAYVTVRYIIGPQAELHIFDVTNLASPQELGASNLETTVNGMAVRKRLLNGKRRTYLYAATAHDSKELAVYDVTDPANVSTTPIEKVDLPGSQDGESVGVQGNTLYFGRASNTAGPELYVFDISSTTANPTVLGTAEVTSKDITAVVPLGPYLFLAATADGVSNRMVEVWDIHDATHPTLRSAIKVPGLSPGGIDYADQYISAVGTSTFLMYHGD